MSKLDNKSNIKANKEIFLFENALQRIQNIRYVLDYIESIDAISVNECNERITQLEENMVFISI